MPIDPAAVHAAWDVQTRRYVAGNTCHHRQVVQVNGSPVVACGSADVGSRATVTPIERALSNAGACGPEAVFWLHPSDAGIKPPVKATTRERIAALSAQLAAQKAAA